MSPTPLEKRGRGWEEKRIKREIGVYLKDIIRENRDWLLGGQEIDWEWSEDLPTGDIILRRK